MQSIGNLVLNPPANEKYQAIKQRLSNFEESEESKIRKLLTGKEIGDQNPTHFHLSTMKMLAGIQVSDMVLKSLFMEQLLLLEKVRSILAITRSNIKSLAEQADLELPRSQAISKVTIEPMQVYGVTSPVIENKSFIE